MSYPDVVIACIEHKVSLEAFRAIEAALRSTIIIWRIILGGWLITITAKSFKLFSLWQSQHAVCHCQKVVKLQLNYCNALVIKWIYNIVLFGGKNAGCSFLHHFLIDVYALFSDVSLRRQVSNDPGWEIPGPFLLKSDVNLFNHLVRKRMLRVVVLRVLFFVDMRLPCIQCHWFVLSGCFYVKLMQIN